MRRSTERILTTHVGSLPAPTGLDVRAADYEAQLTREVEAIVRRQVALGIDIIDDGELSKGHWLAYLNARLSGFEERPAESGERPVLLTGEDRRAFPDFYREATERGTLFYSSGYQNASPSSVPTRTVCTGPIVYAGTRQIERDVRNLERALAAVEEVEAFLPVAAPASIEPYRFNDYYPSEKAFLYALADALRVEYETIAGAGLLLQVDDAWTAALWDRVGIPLGVEAYKRRCLERAEVLNHALARIPRERIRYHLCWGSWHGPHANDLPLSDLVEAMLAVKAGAYSFEAANARHEHEYHVWERVAPPSGCILIPGVVSHATNVIEHPQLVAERIGRFAKLVGRENVIAGTDCGFGGRIHSELAWAKLAALVEGARLASQALGYR
ncbi:MAG: cobalamin-independent methionine synthase II family protein [Steroidobacteraceae bacterium]